MTRPTTLNVEYDELLARADELDRPLPTIPSTDPAPPCALPFAKDAATQLALSANAIRLYLQGCEREWKSLARSLRKAADAYAEVDAQAADAIDYRRPASAAAPASVRATDPLSVQVAAEGDWPIFPLPPIALPSMPLMDPVEFPYYEVRQAAMDIEDGDQGAAFKGFAHDWDAFQRALQQEAYRFRPFSSWDGDARAAVEQIFEQHRQWIYSVAQLCFTLRSQALNVVDAHKRLRAASGSASVDADRNFTNPEEHPGPIDVENADYWYETDSRWFQEDLPYAIARYERLQAKSEEALRLYVANAQLPLAPANPSMYPTAGVPDLKLPGVGPESGIGAGVDSTAPAGEPPAGAALPDPTGMPAVPAAGMPTMSGASMPVAAGAPANRFRPGPSTAPRVKPASFAGGGIGRGAVAAPLQEASFPESSPPARAANGAGGPGRAMPGAAAGGGGMGMAPMAPAGARGQNAETRKRAQQEERALYTERRPWTEAVIGRRSKPAPDREAAKHLSASRS